MVSHKSHDQRRSDDCRQTTSIIFDAVANALHDRAGKWLSADKTHDVDEPKIRLQRYFDTFCNINDDLKRYNFGSALSWLETFQKSVAAQVHVQMDLLEKALAPIAFSWDPDLDPATLDPLARRLSDLSLFLRQVAENLGRGSASVDAATPTGASHLAPAGATAARFRTPIVFISSTSEDLKDHRAQARDAAIQAGFLPRMMEYFAASGANPPLEACLAKIAGSKMEPPADVLVVIVAHRYGWVPPDQPGLERKNITWLECEEAKMSGKEVVAFVVNKVHTWPHELREETRASQAIAEGKDTPELLAEVKDSVVRLGQFKAWLDSQGTRTEFTTPESLHSKVIAALYDWRDRHAEFRLSAADNLESGSPGLQELHLGDREDQLHRD